MTLTKLALAASRSGEMGKFTLRQIAMLGLLSTERELDFRELVDGIGLTEKNKGPVSRACDKLEIAGFVKRTRNAEDGRRVWVSITPAGDEATRSFDSLRATGRAA